MPHRITLEIAVDCEVDAATAADAGADRLELCSDLAGHGYTPAASLILAAASIRGICTVAMVRPASATPSTRAFVYSGGDRAMLLREAGAVLHAGAGGLVFGCLNPNFEVDRVLISEFVAIAAGQETVFHRAIDLTPDPIASARILADLGVTRILTSGMTAAATASDLGAGSPSSTPSLASWQAGGDALPRRLERLAALVHACGDRIEVLPGGGIRPANVREFLEQTGCRQVHSSGRDAGRFDPETIRGLRAAIDAAR